MPENNAAILVGQAILPAAAFQAAISGHAQVFAPGERRRSHFGEFHFYTGRLVGQTIALRGLLPRAFGSGRRLGAG
jgi:hypothetical protein